MVWRKTRKYLTKKEEKRRIINGFLRWRTYKCRIRRKLKEK
jgi:hypothetical protein